MTNQPQNQQKKLSKAERRARADAMVAKSTAILNGEDPSNITIAIPPTQAALPELEVQAVAQVTTVQTMPDPDYVYDADVWGYLQTYDPQTMAFGLVERLNNALTDYYEMGNYALMLEANLEETVEELALEMNLRQNAQNKIKELEGKLAAKTAAAEKYEQENAASVNGLLDQIAKLQKANKAKTAAINYGLVAGLLVVTYAALVTALAGMLMGVIK